MTWGSGTEGVKGVVSAGNSLVGTSKDDLLGNPNGLYGVGSGITILSNGNYVVRSPWWNNGAVAEAGAVTWGSGTEGVKGVVSAANSLVGITKEDFVGHTDTGAGDGMTVLSNGNYLVSSPLWDNGATVDAGAVTWGSAAAGVSGPVSSSNSLIGSSTADRVGTGSAIKALDNGNYLVLSPTWDYEGAKDAGAVTFGSGLNGVTGLISPGNSLIGNEPGDHVGESGANIRSLTNGNYVVPTPTWHQGAGAVTWSSGTAGITGLISGSNSLIGRSPGEGVGATGIEILNNGNYLVLSAAWNGWRGAVTWGNGMTGISGEVSSVNSLVGGTEGDGVGGGWGDKPGIYPLNNGNYLVNCVRWSNGVAEAGAVTWGSGQTGVRGVVSPENSLTGDSTYNHLGASGLIVSLGDDGTYVTLFDGGAVVLGDGKYGTRGALSGENSVFGSQIFPAYVYNPVTSSLIVGYSGYNRISLLKLIHKSDSEALKNWQSLYFGNATVGTGKLEDFDSDGVSNLLEFAFGTHPAESGSGLFGLKFTGTVIEGGLLTATGSPIMVYENGIPFAFFVRRRDYAVAGLNYSVQFSADLNVWTTFTMNPQLLADDRTYQIVSLRYPSEMEATAQFFRVKIDVAP